MGESSGMAVSGSFSAARSGALSWPVLVPSLRLLLTSARTRCASCCMNSQASPALVPGNHSWTIWMASTARGKSGATASTCSSAIGRWEYGGRGSGDGRHKAMFSLCRWVKGERWGFEGHELISSFLGRRLFYSTLGDDVDGTLSPDSRRVHFLWAPTCCWSMDSLSI